MDIASFDGGNDVEHNGVGLVEIDKYIRTCDDARLTFLWNRNI